MPNEADLKEVTETEYSIHDASKDVVDDPSDETEQEPDEATADEEATDDTDAVVEDEADPADTWDEGIQPDEKILDALKDSPELQKRLQDQFKGLNKKERQLAQKQSTFDAYVAVDTALNNKDTALAALQQLADHVERTHGLKFGTQQATTQADSESKYGFQYASDDKILEAAIAKVKQELGVDPELMKDLVADRARRQEEQALNTWFDRTGPQIIARVEKLENWKVTKEQVIEAKKRYPDMKPIDALMSSFPREYAKAVAKRGTSRRLPELMDSTSARARTEKRDPMDYDIYDAYADIQK